MEKKYFCLQECVSWKCGILKHGMRTGAGIGLCAIIPFMWPVILFSLGKKWVIITAHEAARKEMGK